MNPKIIFLDEYSIAEADLAPIKRLGDYTGYENAPADKVVEYCRGAQVVITNKVVMSAETIAQLPELKLICVAATGMNNIDLDAAKKAGVEVRNAVDYSTNAVAEQTFTGALALLKQLIYMDEFVKSGRYSESDRLFNYDRTTYELDGKKWGIIGLGNIGRLVASIATAFGCKVLYYSTSGRNDNKEFDRVATLDELLAQSDIVSIHAPLSPETHHLIDYHQLSLMKKSAIIVNMARGPLINEEGLARALDDGLIAGAALDVYGVEPMAKDNPLRRVKDQYKLVMTPHQAWSTKESRQRLIGKIADNISAFLAQ